MHRRWLCFLCLIVSLACQHTPSLADAAALAKTQLKKENIEEILLTPTNDSNPLLFQIEGKRDGKAVSGSVEVDYQSGTPVVKINLFEMATTPATKP